MDEYERARHDRHAEFDAAMLEDWIEKGLYLRPDFTEGAKVRAVHGSIIGALTNFYSGTFLGWTSRGLAIVQFPGEPEARWVSPIYLEEEKN